MRKIKFSVRFEANSNYQLRKLNRAIDLYAKDVYEKSKHIRYINKANGFGYMQPLALKNISDVIINHLEPVIGYNNISFFTIVFDESFDFRKGDWDFRYKDIKKTIKEVLKGHSYIANVSIDEFSRNKTIDGALITPHIHGVFFKRLSRSQKENIVKNIKSKFVGNIRIRPFIIKNFYLDDAIHYSFKALYGCKMIYKRVKQVINTQPSNAQPSNIQYNTESKIKVDEATFKTLYLTYINMRKYKIYSFMFAGGKGKKIIKKILKEVKKQ